MHLNILNGNTNYKCKNQHKIPSTPRPNWIVYGTKTSDKIEYTTYTQSRLIAPRCLKFLKVRGRLYLRL